MKFELGSVRVTAEAGVAGVVVEAADEAGDGSAVVNLAAVDADAIGLALQLAASMVGVDPEGTGRRRGRWG